MMLRLLFVADGRSPIALNWIGYFVAQGYEVHLASTFPCTPELALASVTMISVAFSSAAGERKEGEKTGGENSLRRLSTPKVRTAVRQWLGPLTLRAAGRQLRELVTTLQPDLVHAMRIPYEGMIAAMALRQPLPERDRARTHTPADHHPPAQAMRKLPPLLTSVWGNDFTLHARSNPMMVYFTRLALRGANALHTDCHRDATLAHAWGFAPEKPRVVLPGGGGVQMDVFYPPGPVSESPPSAQDAAPATVINPRGFRAYVHNDSFFHAIPQVLAEMPDVRFICPTMAGEAQAERWIAKLGIGYAVTLLPHVSRAEMADLFRRSQVAVSPSFHDGTPNTLLEAMACGCFPVAGDIESVREWIANGENGLLVDPADPRALAEAILRALREPDLRAQARAQNTQLIADRAVYGAVMQKAAGFYEGLVGGE